MSYIELNQLAARQLSLVTTGQLRELGLTRRQIEWRHGSGAVVRVRTGVYRFAGAPVTWEQSVLAVILGAKAPVVASHMTAASLWQLRYHDRDAAGIHVTGPRYVRLVGVVSHTGRITDEECTTRRAVPVTTPERTVMDLAGILTVGQLGECVDDAIRRDLLHLPTLRRVTERAESSHGGRRLLAPLHAILADRIAGYRPDESDFETRMNAAWDRLRLPRAERQFEVRCGRRSYRLDRAIPEAKIGIEWDSLAHHGTRSGMDRDSDRRADLTAQGWVILNFTWNSQPERIAAAVLRLWKDRRRQVAS